MNIVIAGSGDIGFHLANLLVEDDHNIILIDLDERLLEHASHHLDVMTIRGDASSISVLSQADLSHTDLYIAATTHETTNLLSSILAKKLGAKRTVARVNNIEYLEKTQRKNFSEMGVDNIFSPRLLASQEIERLIHRCSVTDIFEFEEGELSIVGFTADNSSRLVGMSYVELDEETPDFLIRTIAILRNGSTMIPEKKDRILAGDHIYLSTTLQDFEKLNSYIDKTLQKVKKVMIVGGSQLALETARILEDEFNLSIIIQDEERCKVFLENLNDSLVIHGDAGNIDLLKEEGLESMDAFIALTPNSEINIITSLTAEKCGVYKTIALVDNAAYTHISQNIGVDTLINKKIIAANEIFRYVRKGKVEAIASLQGVNAEIIEFEIHKKNRTVSVPLRELRLPESARIVGIIRDGKGTIPDSEFVFNVGDKSSRFLHGEFS